MNVVFDGVSLSAVSAALPSKVIDMKQFASKFGGHEVDRIIAGTGIEYARVAERLSTGDLCAAAAKSLFLGHNVDPLTIDGLVVVTQTPDHLMPGTAAILQNTLGLSRRVAAIDLNSGCTGYVHGLYQAGMMVASGGCQRVLLLTGDVITKLLGKDDRHVRMLFGDAATATLVERGGDRLTICLESQGDGGRNLGTPLDYFNDGCAARVGYLHMNGAEIMGFVVEHVPRLIGEFLKQCGYSRDDINLFIMHQANQLILSYLRRKMGVEASRMPVAVRSVGNTGPSSIPLFMTMTCGLEFDQRALERVALCGFGVGLSLGATLVDLRHTKIIQPVNVDENTN